MMVVSFLNSLLLSFILQFDAPTYASSFALSAQNVRIQVGLPQSITSRLQSCLHLSSTDSNDDEAIDISVDERLRRVRLSRATGIEWGTDLSFSFVYVRALEPAGKNDSVVWTKLSLVSCPSHVPTHPHRICFFIRSS